MKIYGVIKLYLTFKKLNRLGLVSKRYSFSVLYKNYDKMKELMK